MRTKTKFRTLLAVGILLALGPVWGALGTVAGMLMAFSHMGESGMGKPEVLAGDIGVALYTTAAGLIVCPIGIACIVISCTYLNRMKIESQNPDQSADHTATTPADSV